MIGANNDTKEMGALLRTSGVFNEVQTLEDHAATKRAVSLAVADTLQSAGESDTLLLYFAGHGLPVESRYHFVSHDTDLNYIRQTSVDMTEVRDAFDQSASQRVIMFLDCCHSGMIAGSRSLDSRAFQVTGQGKIIVAACSPDEKAYGSTRNGLFTRALLDGLAGAAAVAGEVTANSLFDFIDRRLTTQKPMYFGQQRGRIVLSNNFTGRRIDNRERQMWLLEKERDAEQQRTCRTK